MVDAEIFQHRGVTRQQIRFDTLVLRFTDDNQWRSATWEFSAGEVVTRLPAESIEEITAIAGHFDVSVIDGQGGMAGPFTVQSAMCGYPSHSFCFLFKVDDEDLWSGHTVTRSFGKIVCVPYRFDPT